MIIEVKDIKRSFSSVKKSEGLKGTFELLFRPQKTTHYALKGVSFSIEPGSFVGLIGANGAGKTTLLKILSGLIPPSSGEAKVLGFTPFKRSLEFRRQISLVMGQKAQLWWDLPARDAFDLLKAIYEIDEKKYNERLEELSTLLDVKNHLHTQIRRLSLGERMKMELIGALLHWPQVIFLDEPTIGLDVLAAHKLREFLKVFNEREKATIILTSHNMDDIERLCSRVMILKTGEMVFDGAPHALTNQEEQRLRVRLLENPSLEELSQITKLPIQKIRPEVSPQKEESSIFFFDVHKDQVVSTLHPLMQKYKLIDMGIEGQDLEAVIQKIYEDAKSE